MDKTDEINHWLISEARALGDGAAIVNGYAARLVSAGVPLLRANIAQRFANPLLVAWGVIWTPEGSSEYDVTHEMLKTVSYVGSPFEYVLENETTLHKSLIDLDARTEHSSYIELADAGGKDLFATFLLYGDGSKNGCTFVTGDPAGFSQENIDLIQNTRFGLASAMEPVTMRRSTESLLRAYIGNGPATAVTEGSIMRGEQVALEAVVMFTDLRGFTEKSEKWDDSRLLRALNGYFDAVVKGVEDNGGDVLKFMGDGILSIFKIDESKPAAEQCHCAIRAASAALAELDLLNTQRAVENEDSLSIGVGINLGTVTYGNIGSPDRLDFTVLGRAVNIASRVQDLCKSVGKPVLVTQSVADCIQDELHHQGSHAVRGVAEPVAVFSLEQ